MRYMRYMRYTCAMRYTTVTPRSGRRRGEFEAHIVARLEERGGHAVTVLDPRSAGDGFFMQLMEKAYFHYKPS